jgi:putative protease
MAGNDLKRSFIEIMSPVGSFEALGAAIEAGADSVYFGVGEMNMRAAMKVSFSEDDLPKIAEICQQHEVKSYLALNIIIYDDELAAMEGLVDKAKASNISAIIACDHSVLEYCREIGMPVHISTQANISNIREVEYYSRFADTMVLGRELSLEQLANIAAKIKKRQIKGPAGNLVRIEVFVHGYFCMAISGKCYLSLQTYNSPANRGECKVPCKRKYVATDAKNGAELMIDNDYILSAKDLCTIDFVDKLIEAGISVFKIEGRKKGADYVYTATKCYKEAVDAYFDGTYTQEKINDWKIELSTVFNRGFWSGYYLGEKIEDEECSGDPTARIIKEKVYLARGVGYIEEEKRGEFKLEGGKLQDGDDILIVGPLVGVIRETAKGIRIAGRKVTKVGEGEVFTLPSQEIIGVKDKLYKVSYDNPNFVIVFAINAARKILSDKGYNRLRRLILGKKVNRQ